MGFRRKISGSGIQGETVHLVNPTLRITVGTTITTNTTHGGTRTNKKQKRDEPTPSTSTASINEISDDSDASSDDERFPKQSLSGGLNHRLQLGIKKRKKHHKGRRQVVFGDVVSTTRYYEANLTIAELRDLKRVLWFTKQDRLRSQAECLEVLKTFRIQNVEEVTQFSAVYRTSMQVPFSQESSDYLEGATVSVPLTIRGMEWGLAPKLKKRRKEHIQSVLALQGHIRDDKLRERFVSSRSLQSSRPARIMARMIGEGDASASKLGRTSTALNITTVPMAKTTTKKTATEMPSSGTKLSLREPQQLQKVVTTICTRTTKMGHARRPRRPILWRK